MSLNYHHARKIMSITMQFIKKKPWILITVSLICVLVIVTAFLQTDKVTIFNKAQTTEDINSIVSKVTRGQPNDFWADVVLGKRDFTEISPGEIVPNRVFNPGGVVIDRNTKPGRAYIWDGGNSRIIGIDLAKCYKNPSNCSADLVIGQPSAYDYGACNRDASFQTYPKRPSSGPNTLCGLAELTHTIVEDKTPTNMFVDSRGDLYVPDVKNHRILLFPKPFSKRKYDQQATEVWGQPDFTGNGCNITGTSMKNWPFGDSPKPSAQSLCFHSENSYGAGVVLDNYGNLWVADGGNNRVLRFPKRFSGISKTADLVFWTKGFY